MVRRFSHLVALLLISAISVSAQFFTPQRRDEVWRVGEQRTIRYYTKITNYTIALWQEAPSNNFAIRGPILVGESVTIAIALLPGPAQLLTESLPAVQRPPRGPRTRSTGRCRPTTSTWRRRTSFSSG